MAVDSDSVSQFYLDYFGVEFKEKLTVACPFCGSHGHVAGELSIFLNRKNFLFGFFLCSNRCVPGGYPLWFARLAGIPLDGVPGYEPERETIEHPDFPVANIDEEIRRFQHNLSGEILKRFSRRGIGLETLKELKIGFNGRYIVFPYLQENGACYAARCVHPDKREDYFWHGDEAFSTEPYDIFNVQEIARCENGSLFLCEGEDNALVLKQMGFPAIAVANRSSLERLPASRFSWLDNVFLCVRNTPDSVESARGLAARIGYRARIVPWPQDAPRDCDFWAIAGEPGAAKKIGNMISAAKPFSPFVSPQREFYLYNRNVLSKQGDEYRNLNSGFSLFDAALEGIHGINVIGGAPKAGKSTWMIQMATQLALRGVPVLYYDFENGRQRIYQRTMSRLARIEVARLGGEGLSESELTRLEEAKAELEKLLFHLRVVNDRKLSPELMRKHIEFIRHETRSSYTVVVIDSLNKLPFKEFSERRTGIDAWLRQFESIRDELDVSFLVISELTRGEGGSYDGDPHMGLFKGSGDIEYSADNAMILMPEGAGIDKCNKLWIVASREHSPGLVAQYALDYPFWGFVEEEV